MNIDWIDVLQHFERKGYVNNGLTLPFLIGYIDVLEPGASLQTVRGFIREASNMPDGITIMSCGNIGEWVFGSLDPETNEMRRQYRNLYKEFGNIIVTDHSFKDCNDLEAMISELEAAYNDDIMAKNFSKIGGRWQYYSPEEQNQIRELLSE
jgi:hypothetical protein